MKTPLWKGLTSILLMMVGMLFVIRCAPGQWGLRLYALDLVWINALFSFALGWFTGRHIRQLWFFPILSPLVFLISVPLILKGTLAGGQWRDYLPYACKYLALGGLGTLAGWIFFKVRKKES